MISEDYIGSLARLMPVQWSSSLSESDESPYVIQAARSRRWAFSKHRPGFVPPREWSISLTSNGEAASVLRDLMQGAYGAGPFVWVPVAAHQSNALTPAQSLLPGSTGGPVEAVGGWSPVSVLGPDLVTLATNVPVLPGRHVTVSVDVSGGGAVTADLRSATGVVVGTLRADAAGTAMQRVSVTGVAPVTARTVDVTVTGHVRATRPQVTWTDRAVGWSQGAASHSVIVESASRDLKVVDRFAADSWWDVSAKIVEVG